MSVTKPVADYTPCEQCGHPRALHSDRGCHVITEMRAPKHQPNELCACTPWTVTDSRGQTRPLPTTPVHPPTDEKAFLVEQQQRWVKERR